MLDDNLVLRLRLDLDGAEPQVRGELRRTGWFDQSFGEWSCPPQSVGLPATLERRRTRGAGYSFLLPRDVVAQMRRHLEPYDASWPLWIELVKPYGYLSLVPWERLLQELRRPVLRLLPKAPGGMPYTRARNLRVACCGSRPAGMEDFGLGRHLDRLDAIWRHVGARVDPFVERGRGALRSGKPIDDATAAGPRFSDRPGIVTNPWLLWIQDASASRIDVVHFISHGYTTGTRGALALAESPDRGQDQRSACFVGAAELATFLDRMGAGALVLSSPKNNYSQIGLRLLANGVAERRPGIVLLHEMDEPTGTVIETYRSIVTGRGSLPLSPSTIAYTHPWILDSIEEARHGGLSGSELSEPGQKGTHRGDDRQPAWLRAARRHVEQRRRELRTGQEAAGDVLDRIDEVLDLWSLGGGGRR